MRQLYRSFRGPAAYVVAVTAMLATLTACATKNGNTTCAEYRDMDSKDKIATITAMVSETGKSNPSAATIDTTRASVAAYCFFHPGSDPISNIYRG